MKFDDDLTPSAIIPSGWSDGFGASMPEISIIGRIRQSARFNPIVKYHDRVFTENHFIFMDSTMLNIFHYEFIHKKPGNPLAYPDALLITEEMASKYFGTNNPLDEILTVDGDRNYHVTAVIKMPKNNSFQFNFAALFIPPSEDRVWTHTFVRVANDANIPSLESKLKEFVKDRYGEKGYAVRQGMSPKLQALADIHHYSNLKFEYSNNSGITYIYIFSAVGMIILMITAVNFINLTTARASTRVKEVSIRKAIGAPRIQIITQLLLENLLFVTIAFGVALVLALVLNTTFNNLAGKDIQVFAPFTTTNWVFILIGILTMGLCSGIYPAIFLSAHSFNHQNSLTEPHGVQNPRNFLVIFQFVLSSVMIIGVIVIDRQLRLFQNSELGFDKTANIIVRIPDKDIKDKHESFRKELLRNSSIHNVSFVQTFPGERDKMAVLVYEVKNGDETTIIPTFLTDLHFANTLGINIIQGRDFDNSLPGDRNNCLINRKTAELMGWSEVEAIGREMHAVDLKLKGEVIGVLEDFNFSSLHHEIEPVVIFPVLQFPQAFNSAIINIDKQQITSSVATIERIWREFSVDAPFDYTLLDDHLKILYRDDLLKSKIFRLFGVLSVIISSIGLFGLTIYTLERRTKEISIRKVLGATVNNVVMLISGNFLMLVLVANIIAIPIAFWISKIWLSEFPYRIKLTTNIFLYATILSLLIAFLTIIYSTIKKALVNPADQLKYE